MLFKEYQKVLLFNIGPQWLQNCLYERLIEQT